MERRGVMEKIKKKDTRKVNVAEETKKEGKETRYEWEGEERQ